MKRKRKLGVAAAVGLCLAALVAPQALAAGSSLTGAGSTLITPLMADWAQDALNRYNLSVTYGSVGSGAGITQITARTVDFGASDAPLSPPQASACSGCVQIPWALTATGIAFNISGVRRLRLTVPVLAQIYLGRITNWNDSRIRKLNKGVHLPNLKITPVFRSDGSGDTYAFTDLLSRVSSSFRSQVGNSTSVSFPAGVGGKGNDGVTALVGSTNGSIGYIAASYMIAHHLHAAALQNRAGNYEYPNLKNIQAAGSVVRHVPGNNEMHIVNPPKSVKLAYPLSTFTYVIVSHNSPKKSTLAGFIYYALTLGQRFGPGLDFAPIPSVVKNAGIHAVQGL